MSESTTGDANVSAEPTVEETQTEETTVEETAPAEESSLDEPNTEDTNAGGTEVTSEAEAGLEGAGPAEDAEPLVPSNDGDGETAYVAPTEDEGETAFKDS